MSIPDLRDPAAPSGRSGAAGPDGPAPGGGAGGPARSAARGPAVAVAVGLTLVAVAAGWGAWLGAQGVRLHVSSLPPLTGDLDLRLPAALLAPVLLGAVCVWWLPGAAARWPWPRLVAVSGVLAGAWAVALALVDGVSALGAPLATRWEYLRDVDRVGAIGPFLSTFNDHVLGGSPGFQWVTHVSGHPPGALLAFVGLDRLGLGGSGWAAALCIGAGASAVPAVLLTVRLLGTETAARRALPFVALSPAALWVATSADALFCGVAAWGVYALAYAGSRRGLRGDVVALAGGLLLGGVLFLSYGLALAGVLALAAVLVQRRVRPLLVGGLGVVALVGWFAANGFWWLDGLATATARVREGSGWIDRPGTYFALANLAALAYAVGPATLGGLGAAVASFRARHGLTGGTLGRALVLPAAALLAVALAVASNHSKGEVERIYLPFEVWLLPLAALLPARHHRAWLAAQVAVTLVITVCWRLRW